MRIHNYANVEIRLIYSVKTNIEFIGINWEDLLFVF